MVEKVKRLETPQPASQLLFGKRRIFCFKSRVAVWSDTRTQCLDLIVRKMQYAMKRRC